MSRKSVIQLVPEPVSRGNASDLRYRLLMAALGASEETNPLLLADAAEDANQAPNGSASPDSLSQATPAAEPHAIEPLAVAEHEDQAISVTFVKSPAPSTAAEPPAARPPNNTETQMPAATGRTPLPRAPKRR